MKKTIKIPSQIKLQTEFFEGYGMTELIKSIIVLVISSIIAYCIYKITRTTLLATFLGLIVLSLIVYLAHSSSRENKYLIHLSEIDPLTSVFNKETTQKLIDQKLNNKEHCCFLILDVDAFKSVNDNYGHAVGDKVLENLGLLFKNHFRQSDIVGRIGGDEFIILIQDENIAESRIQSLLQKVNELKIEELKDFKLSISIGIAFAPKDGTTFMELYRHADQALYQTKRTGKNNYKIYKNDEN